MQIGANLSVVQSDPPAEIFEPKKSGKLTIDDALTLHNALVDGTAYERITTVV